MKIIRTVFLLLLIFLIYIDCTKKDQQVMDASTVTTVKSVAASSSFPPYKGVENPRILLMIFGDFQCPHTANLQVIIDRILQNFEKDIGIVFHQLPLQVHKFSEVAAFASLAALKQGKFWEYHDGLFRLQRENRFNIKEMDNLLKTLGLDPVKFQVDFRSTDIAEMMSSEKKLAAALRIEASPTILVNGRMLVGIQSFDDLAAVIYKEIERIDEAMKKGISMKDAYEIIAESTNPLYGKYIIKKEKLPDINPASNIRVSDEVYAVALRENEAGTGPKDAFVTIVEFGNYRCPWCRKAEGIMKELLKQYPRDLRWIFKQNPLPMYPDSEIAGMASLAALEQGKFPEMHTLLMQAEGTFNESSLEKIASEAGLDIKSFREAMKSERIKARIEEDMDLAMTITAKGTPNFYINGRKITGLIPLEDFKTVIEIEKNKALDMISKGVTTQELYNRLIQGGIKISPLGPDKQEINISSSPAAGNPDADYKFIIFSDFASPLSKRAAESLNELFKVYGNKMCLYFKHFPLDVHKEASVAAIASTCAHQQNKFFQYHDMLFQNQNDLSLSALQSYAEKIGMDMLKFNQCILEQKTNSIILEDIKEGKALNIRTVPALFINGRQFIPALGWGKEDIQRVIERYLKN